MYVRPKRADRKERTPKAYRFDAWLNEHQKWLIQRATDLEGRTLTDFVLHSAETAAQRIIYEHTIMVLSAKNSEAFAQALLTASREPSATLHKAAKRYEKRFRI